MALFASPASPVASLRRFIVVLLVSTAAVYAVKPVPENLGNGLDALVASNLAIKAGAPASVNGFATAAAASYAADALKDAATG